MTNKINNILLSILWTTAITLGACFWFNTMFGFNLLSGAHWHHLAYMQASQNPVKAIFYISLVCFVIILIYGWYIVIRPNLQTIRRTRKIHTKQQQPAKSTTPPAPAPAPMPVAESAPIPVTEPEQPITEQTTQLTPAPVPVPYASSDNTQTNATLESEAHLTRPPRLNLSIQTNHTPALNNNQTAVTTPTTFTPTQSEAQPADWMHLGDIFTDAGYTVKNAPNINGLQTSLMAIGTNENVWIGAVGIKTNIFNAALNVVRQVFADTLEDIEITVHGFIISAPDATNPASPDILTFDSPNNLREYMNKHRNPPLPSDDNGNFDAFSSYISTVIDYLEKL